MTRPPILNQRLDLLSLSQETDAGDKVATDNPGNICSKVLTLMNDSILPVQIEALSEQMTLAPGDMETMIVVKPFRTLNSE